MVDISQMQDSAVVMAAVYSDFDLISFRCPKES